jgi:protein-S-isoprenylcysteine O-methyltransferase Ste14
MHISPRALVGSLWLTGLVVWAIGAFLTKRAARRQSSRSRWLQGVLAILAMGIGFARPFNSGWPARPFISGAIAVQYTGVALTAVGVAFAIWARFALGSNWSGVVTVKEGHTLIENGPYAVVRHPIYTGVLVAYMGAAIVFRQVRVLIGFVFMLALLLSKISIEERFMTQEFGVQYAEYKRRVKALIPFVY